MNNLLRAGRFVLLATVVGSCSLTASAFGQWFSEIKLLPTDGAANDYLRSVAIDNRVVAYGNDDNGSESGSAYLFDADTGARSPNSSPPTQRRATTSAHPSPSPSRTGSSRLGKEATMTPALNPARRTCSRGNPAPPTRTLTAFGIEATQGNTDEIFFANSEGRLSAYGKSGAFTGISYDHAGVRTATQSAAGTRLFLTDSMNPTGYTQVISETGPNARSYVLGDDVLAQDRGSGAELLSYDGHGNTRELITASTSVVAETYDYDAYGDHLGGTVSNPIDMNWDGEAQPLTDMLYTGEQRDQATGMTYLRARYLDTQTGLFNRLDPFFGNASDPQSLHKYAYVHNEPVNNWDPSGKA